MAQNDLDSTDAPASPDDAAAAARKPPPRAQFFKQHVLPALLVFLVPVFSVWFFARAERTTDREVVQSIESSVRRDATLSAEKRERILAFYRANPPSRILASRDPQFVAMHSDFASVSTRYAIFRWMQRVAWLCLGAIALTYVIVGSSVWYSLRSHAAQYRALRIGWPVLQFSAAIQVLGQGALAVMLSFWVTALFLNRYSLKLIAVIGLLAAVAVLALWKAIFSKVDDRCEVSGETLQEADAPRLWQNVRALAAKLSTAAPDQIIVGIEPSFFVTEHPVTLGAKIFQGRTLYLSLPMLKVLATDEADAVLGHELAHFSGDDTLWARKISPLLGRFTLYLQNLSAGLSLVVAHFMHLFWKLYGLSLRRLSRQREFRADQVGAEAVSPDAMKRALVKTTCYCEYRAETESAILRERRVDRGLDLAGRLEGGYPAFLAAFAQNQRTLDDRIPHPFDTHPTLHNRLEKLGFEAPAALRDASLQTSSLADSWYGAINTAPALEQRLWSEQQTVLQEFHDQTLAWRLLPEGEEETAQVRKHFPSETFHDEEDRKATLEFDRIQMPDWEAPIFFKDISNVEVKDAWGKKRLTITHLPEGAAKAVKTKCHPELFKGDGGDLLAAFDHYYSRHTTAKAVAKEGAPPA